ncbi:hypothetical protein GCM10009731_32620 [Streptomyces globosus]
MGAAGVAARMGGRAEAGVCGSSTSHDPPRDPATHGLRAAAPGGTSGGTGERAAAPVRQDRPGPAGGIAVQVSAPPGTPGVGQGPEPVIRSGSGPPAGRWGE